MLGTSIGIVYLDHASQANRFRGLHTVHQGNIFKGIRYTTNPKLPKTPWRIKGFRKFMKEVISMFTLILGKDDNSIVVEGLVGILDAYNTRRSTHSFIYAWALET